MQKNNSSSPTDQDELLRLIKAVKALDLSQKQGILDAIEMLKENTQDTTANISSSVNCDNSGKMPGI